MTLPVNEWVIIKWHDPSDENNTSVHCPESKRNIYQLYTMVINCVQGAGAPDGKLKINKLELYREISFSDTFRYSQ